MDLSHEVVAYNIEGELVVPNVVLVVDSVYSAPRVKASLVDRLFEVGPPVSRVLDVRNPYSDGFVDSFLPLCQPGCYVTWLSYKRLDSQLVSRFRKVVYLVWGSSYLVSELDIPGIEVFLWLACSPEEV